MYVHIVYSAAHTASTETLNTSCYAEALDSLKTHQALACQGPQSIHAGQPSMPTQLWAVHADTRPGHCRALRPCRQAYTILRCRSMRLISIPYPL